MLKAYIPILISSTVSLAAVMALVAMIEPGLFMALPGQTPQEAIQKDSSATTLPDEKPAATFSDVPALAPDSVKLETQTADLNPPQPFISEDSLKQALAPLNVVVKRANNEPEPGDTLSIEEKKKMAKIFEAMDAGSAARILYNMEDQAVKSILSQMKPRQSAKVLAELDPKQAARILKGEGK